jgi:WD40 repeat protein
MSQSAAPPLELKVGGTLTPGEHLYITRPADRILRDLLRRGEYCNVLTSRQMGKSSLMAQTAVTLSAEGYHVATPDVSLLGEPDTADEWYRGLLAEVVRELNLEADVHEWWRNCPEATPNQRLLRFFREEVAARLAGQTVIFLDEVDSTLKLPYTDDFFVAIRAMYNQRGKMPEYRRIAFCLVGVATPNELIKDRRTTPYNIGKTVELSDFDPARGDDLGPLYRAVADDAEAGRAIIERVLNWTGGHPYLTLKVCEEFVAHGESQADDVDRLVCQSFASLDELQRDTHFEQVLRFLSERVEDKLTTLNLYRRILRGEEVRDQTAPAHIALKLAGIVKRDRHGRLVSRNRIYARIFTDEWAARTAEADAQAREEAAGLKAAAEVNEKILREALDDYRVALGAYRSLRDNPAYGGNADELWAEFFERRALRAEERRRRDEALLWRVRAQCVLPAESRARVVGELVGADFERLAQTFRHRGDVYAVAFSPDGRLVATTSVDGMVGVWEIATGHSVGTPLRHEGWDYKIAFSPNGRLVTTANNSTVRVWEVETGRVVSVLRRGGAAVTITALSPDGRLVAMVRDEGTAQLWETVTGHSVGAALHHENYVNAVAFSPDGRLVATAGGGVRVWEAATGQLVGAVLRPRNSISVVAFSPDGRLVAAASGQTVQFWEPETGRTVGVALHHETHVNAVAFSHDGRLVATAGGDQTARVWEVATGRTVGTVLRHDSWVGEVVFSPDGRLVATAGGDQTARVWKVVAAQPVSAALRHDQTQSKPIAGDAAALLREWERRLALHINAAGEIVPLYP